MAVVEQMGNFKVCVVFMECVEGVTMVRLVWEIGQYQIAKNEVEALFSMKLSQKYSLNRS